MATMGPQLAAHSFNPITLMLTLISTPISTGMTLNVAIACVCLMILNHTEGRVLGINTWIPFLHLISLALPPVCQFIYIFASELENKCQFIV